MFFARQNNSYFIAFSIIWTVSKNVLLFIESTLVQDCIWEHLAWVDLTQELYR